MTYAADQLRDEVAYVAYHFHWGLDQILDLEHGDRRGFVTGIAGLNARAAEG
ncbi:hypothetical protein ABIA35_007976 [Catenulispora sp. MAP12-49]|uniref:DUF6760 family protein n=1 Tax=unclassified Catenulispora TaxID=414885 RepID=UPI003519386D